MKQELFHLNYLTNLASVSSKSRLDSNKQSQTSLASTNPFAKKQLVPLNQKNYSPQRTSEKPLFTNRLAKIDKTARISKCFSLMKNSNRSGSQDRSNLNLLNISQSRLIKRVEEERQRVQLFGVEILRYRENASQYKNIQYFTENTQLQKQPPQRIQKIFQQSTHVYETLSKKTQGKAKSFQKIIVEGNLNKNNKIRKILSWNQQIQKIWTLPNSSRQLTLCTPEKFNRKSNKQGFQERVPQIQAKISNKFQCCNRPKVLVYPGKSTQNQATFNQEQRQPESHINNTTKYSNQLWEANDRDSMNCFHFDGGKSDQFKRKNEETQLQYLQKQLGKNYQKFISFEIKKSRENFAGQAEKIRGKNLVRSQIVYQGKVYGLIRL